MKISKLIVFAAFVVTLVLSISLTAFHSYALSPSNVLELNQGQTATSASPSLLATAAGPPELKRERMSWGAMFHVLYITRSSDAVRVRCYPGFVATLTNPGERGNTASDRIVSCQQK